MNDRRKQHFHLLAAIALSALLLGSGTAFADPVELTIVHFNDLDRMDESEGQGGIARLAAVIKAERAGSDHVLVTFAGDTISPSLMSGIDQGAHMIDLLNRLDLTAMAIGNHEYDFGPEVATQRFAEASFPILGANNLDADGGIIDGAQDSILVPVDRFQVGIFGLTTLDTAVKSSPGAVTFRDVEAVAAEQAALLRAKGAHLVDRLDAHRCRREPGADRAGRGGPAARGRRPPAAAGLQRRRAASRSRASRTTGSPSSTWYSMRRRAATVRGSCGARPSASSTSARVEPDAQLAAAVQGYLDLLSDDLDIVIVTTTTVLDSRRSTVHSRDAAIGNLIADALRSMIGADVAITNGGGIRGGRIYEACTVLTPAPHSHRAAVREPHGRAGVNRARQRRGAETAPARSYAADHPLIDDLKRKDFYLSAKLDRKSVTSEDFAARLEELWAFATPFMRLVTETALALPF